MSRDSLEMKIFDEVAHEGICELINVVNNLAIYMVIYQIIFQIIYQEGACIMEIGVIVAVVLVIGVAIYASKNKKSEARSNTRNQK